MILYIIYKDSTKKKHNNNINGDLVIKETDIMQLQELAVDIKLGKVEKIEQDSTALEHQNRNEVIEVIVEEMVEKENKNNSNNGNITTTPLGNGNNNNEMIINEPDGKAAVDDVPRG